MKNISKILPKLLSELPELTPQQGTCAMPLNMIHTTIGVVFVAVLAFIGEIIIRHRG
jgi:hypothetical protein